MLPFGRFLVRFRFGVVIFWIVCAILVNRFLPSLASVTNSDIGSFLPSTTPSLQAQQLTNVFSNPAVKSTATLVASRASGQLTADDQSAVTQLVTQLATDHHVLSLRDQGISADGQARRIQINLDISSTDSAAKATVSALRRTITDASRPNGLQVNLTGSLPTSLDIRQASQDSSRLTERLSNIAIIVMLLFVFRSLLAPFVTLAPALIALFISGPVIAQLSHLLNFQVSGETQTILTVLVLGAGTDYGLFLALRFEEELRNGMNTQDAVARTVERVGESVTFSAGTVIVALLSLVLATFGVYKNLGPSLAIGITVTLIVSLTLLPALMAIFGHTLYWPRRLTAIEHTTSGWGRIATSIIGRPAITLVAGVVFFALLSIAALRYAPAGFSGTTAAPSGSDSAIGTATLNAHFPAALTRGTIAVFTYSDSVWTHLTTVSQAQQALQANSGFAAVTGLLNPSGNNIDPNQLVTLYTRLGPPAQLPIVNPYPDKIPSNIYNAYRATAQFVSPDGRTVQFFTRLSVGDPASPEALHAVPALRTAVTDAARATNATASGLVGQAPVSYDVSTTSDSDLFRIVPIVMLLIGLLLALAMRSLVAPIYLVVSVVLSFFASLGLAVLIFMVIGGSAGLNFVLPFLMFVFLMALGEDYNILVMSRIREEAMHRPLAQAVAIALGATGSTVTSAGVILAATFGVAGIFGNSDQLHQLGTGIALGILLDTFLVRTLLVPSTVVLLGRWNWWPSPLGRRPATPDQVIQPTVAE